MFRVDVRERQRTRLENARDVIRGMDEQQREQEAKEKEQMDGGVLRRGSMVSSGVNSKVGGGGKIGAGETPRGSGGGGGDGRRGRDRDRDRERDRDRDEKEGDGLDRYGGDGDDRDTPGGGPLFEELSGVGGGEGETEFDYLNDMGGVGGSSADLYGGAQFKSIRKTPRLRPIDQRTAGRGSNGTIAGRRRRMVGGKNGRK